MLKKASAFMLILAVLSVSTAQGEILLNLGGSDSNSAEYKEFIEKHPEIAVTTETNIYLSTDEIINAFLTGEFPFDTFVMTSSSFDIQQLMAKGYCAPLTGSSVLHAEMDQMTLTLALIDLNNDENTRFVTLAIDE